MATMQIVLSEKEVESIIVDRLRAIYNIPERAKMVLNWNDDSGCTISIDDSRGKVILQVDWNVFRDKENDYD